MVYPNANRGIGWRIHSRLRFRMKLGDATNEAEYTAYRLAEFDTDTQIKFPDETGDKPLLTAP